jgi:hypothetical protein
VVKPIKFRIRGDRAEGHPTVDDFLEQLRDLIGIIEAVEKAMPDGDNAIEWRVTQATTNSPVAIEATPFPKHAGVNIDARVFAVKTAAARGLFSLVHDTDRPPYFNQAIVGKAKKIADRVTNGLNETVIDWGGAAEKFTLTPQIASVMSANAEVILKPKTRPYTERGTLEGYHDGLSPGTQGKHELFVRNRRTGERVKCILTREAFEDIRHREIEEVLEGRRLQVRGTLHYKAPHQLDRVTAEHVRVMPREDELPSLDEIIDRDFTGGLSTEDYLEWVRGGRRLD